MKRLVTIDDATGNVVSTWRGGDEQTLDPVAGRTHIPVNDDASYDKQRWNGIAFEAVPPVAVDPRDQPLTPREQRQFLNRIAERTDRIP